MVPKYINIVLVKHPGDGKQYTFQVPDNIQLSVGDYVLCNTVRGSEQVGQCISPSFVVGEWQLPRFFGVQSLKNLKCVTHRLIPETLGALCTDDEVSPNA